jgi:hypothetical protein
MSKKIFISIIILAILSFGAYRLFQPSTGRGKVYGQDIDSAAGEAASISAIAGDPAAYEGRNVIIEAKIARVCQTSGCWLILTDGANNLFVQFYDFTVNVPAGKTARVQGVIRLQNQAPYLAGQGMEIGR